MTADIIFEFDRQNGSEPEIYLMSTELTGAEAEIYGECCRLRRSLNGVKGLEGAVERMRGYVERALTYEALELGDEFAAECICDSYISFEELNTLVHSGNLLAIEFFGMEECTEEELKAWDASALEILPPLYFFKEDMEGPFQKGWKLSARFPEVSESEILSCISQEEYESTYSRLLEEGDTETAEEYRRNVTENCNIY